MILDFGQSIRTNVLDERSGFDQLELYTELMGNSDNGVNAYSEVSIKGVTEEVSILRGETVPHSGYVVLPDDPMVPSGANWNLTNRTFDTLDANSMQENVPMGAPPPLPIESQVTLIMLYTCTTLLSVIGNTLVILVFTLGKRSRSDLRLFLINLAVADLIMAVFCMPFTFTMTMLKNWIFSAPMCPIVLYTQVLSVTASVCTNMAIGIDRFWVVTFPLKSRITKSRSKFVICLIWIISGSLSSVQLVVGRSTTFEVAPGVFIHDCIEIWPEPSFVLRRFYTFFILILTYLMPLTILSLTYGIVGVKLWQRTAPGNADEIRDMQQLKSKRKVCLSYNYNLVRFSVIFLHLVTGKSLKELHEGVSSTKCIFSEKLMIRISSFDGYKNLNLII